MVSIKTPVVGILGDDPLTCRILVLLLEGAGYRAHALEEADISADPIGALAGLGLVVRVPSLDGRRGDEPLGVVGGGPQIAGVPVLYLSTRPKAEPTDSVLPWPWSTEALVRAIERAVHAPDGEAP